MDVKVGIVYDGMKSKYKVVCFSTGSCKLLNRIWRDKVNVVGIYRTFKLPEESKEVHRNYLSLSSIAYLLNENPSRLGDHKLIDLDNLVKEYLSNE